MEEKESTEADQAPAKVDVDEVEAEVEEELSEVELDDDQRDLKSSEKDLASEEKRKMISVPKDPFRPEDLSSSACDDEKVMTEADSSNSSNLHDEPLSKQKVRASGFAQVLALLRKNFLTKLRTPVATFFELGSPVMMMLILAAAYTLSDVVKRNEKMYASISLDFPGPWIGLVERSAEMFAIGETRLNFERKLDTLEVNDNLFQESANDHQESWEGVFDGLQDKVENAMFNHAKDLAADQLDDAERKLQQIRNRVDTSDDEMATSYKLLDDAQRELRTLLKGPMRTPSFEAYVGASMALSTAIGVDNLPRIFSESSYGRQWGNLLTLGTLHLSPRNEAAELFWGYLNDTYPLLMLSTSNNTSMRIRHHDDEEAALQFIDKNNLRERTWALLDFSSFDLEEDDSAYKIRMNYTTVPNTARITNWATVGLNTRYQRYYLSGYMTLQRTVNEFALSMSGCGDKDLSSIMSMPMPTPKYSQNPFFTQVGYLLGITMVMAFLYPTSRLIKTVVEEKETRMKEILLILGVRGWAHWLSWFLTSLVIFAIITVSVAFTLTSTVLMHSNAVYILLYVGLFSTATIGFCFAIASFFSRAKLAGIIGPVALFATILPRFVFFGSNRYEQPTAKMIASLCPATAFCFGADIIADYEYAEQGIQSYNAKEGEYSFNTTLGFLFFDTILYTFLGWYLDQVVPQQYGVARPFYFFFLPSYWLENCRSFKPEVPSVAKKNDDSDERLDIECVADVHLIPRVDISNLVKQYNKDDTEYPPAVDGLNLTMYESQITALLGHNGAGKTTTVSVLSGLFPPTSGDCILYGKSIVHNKNEARHSIGICPQHNVLFDDLTVYEHLAFFMRIKGILPEKAKICEHANEIGLIEYLRTTAVALSGGNKRKLSIAIALCGNPDVLILDEPTSAVDPYSRRAVWDLLRAKKKGRVTLLTTHFMDEAELLSDRIAVMKEGKLKCCGSPIFLKDRFGLGYSMTVVLESPAISNDEEGGTKESSDITIFESLRDRLLTFLKQRIPGTTLVRTSGKEVTFRFPRGSESKFQSTFDDLGIEKESLGIGAYGISNSSLEEVFLQLADDLPVDENESSESKDDDLCDTYGCELKHLSPIRQIGLLYGKRFLIQTRDKKGACFAIILPAMVIALVLLILMLEPPWVGSSLSMSPELYQEASTGEDNTVTNVVVGGRGNQTTFEQEVYLMEKAMKERYRNIDVSSHSDAPTSMDLSTYLLDSYNDRDHAVRFGAYVLNDFVNLTLKIDSAAISDAVDTDFLLDSAIEVLGSNTVDLIEVFGLGDENNVLNLTIDLMSLSGMVADSLGLTPNATLNSTELIELLDENIEAMLNSGGAGVLLGNIMNNSVESINATELITLLGLNGDFDREVLILIIDSLLTEMIGSLGFQNDPISIPTAEQIFGLLDAITAQANSTIPGIETYFSFLGGITAQANVTTPDSEILAVAATIFLRYSLDSPNLQRLSGISFNAWFDNILVSLIAEEAADLPISQEDLMLIKITASSLILKILPLSIEVYDLSITTGDTPLLYLPGANINLLENEILQSMIPSQNSVMLQARASILHNSTSPHAVAAFNQAYMEYIYGQCKSSGTSRLTSVNEPLPITTQQSIEVKTILSIVAALFLLIPYCYIPGAFIVFLVKERISKSKHLQLVSGVNMTSYWLATYLWDLTLFCVLTFLIMAIFMLYGNDSAQVFVGDVESFLATAALTFGYGMSILPFSYLLARNFKNPSTAQISVIGLIFITGFVAVNAYFIMSTIEETADVADTLRPIFRLWPAYNIGEGFIQLSSAFWEREVLYSEKKPFDWEVTGISLALLYGLAPFYFLILLFLEYSEDGGSGGFAGRILRHVKGSYDRILLAIHGVRKADNKLLLDDGLVESTPNEDVQKEADYVRCNEGLHTTAPIVLIDLWKIFPPSVGVFGAFTGWIQWFLCCCGILKSSGEKTESDQSRPRRAVRGLTTVIQRGETFGLLGSNGAGKTTTLNMLTGDVQSTGGKAYVAGHDITGIEKDGVADARKNIGFCPQIDPLLALMTGRETLQMFGKLRGIPADKIDVVVDNLLEKLILTPHADKTSESYSGGNKRKLSLGIAALVGEGGVLLIDECSSGLDPLAKKKLWSLIETLAIKRSTIITTHSMEEAEALCSRIGIMAKGQFVALGAVQCLKSKHLDGYNIDLSCKANTPDRVVDSIVEEMLETVVPGSNLSERHGRFLKFEVFKASALGIGATFHRLQELKESGDAVENYSISQCSLEQVFIKLVKEAKNKSSVMKEGTES